MFSTGTGFLESLRFFLIIFASAATCLALYILTSLAILHFTGVRYQATVLDSQRTSVELCAASFYNPSKSIIPSNIIEIGTFSTRIWDLDQEYSHFIVGVPTRARPCSFPYRAGTIISIKVAPGIPLAYLEANPALNFHLPVCLSIIGFITFWLVKILGHYT